MGKLMAASRKTSIFLGVIRNKVSLIIWLTLEGLFCPNQTLLQVKLQFSETEVCMYINSNLVKLNETIVS